MTDPTEAEAVARVETAAKDRDGWTSALVSCADLRTLLTSHAALLSERDELRSRLERLERLERMAGVVASRARRLADGDRTRNREVWRQMADLAGAALRTVDQHRDRGE